ncbi:hypothetical protein BO99DRAFT_398055 [Aspergillus violaceofuscus CBS 115571]|uniref:CBM-cenC domain-containing protein n=1 Tax=Aspergillus violaceofuscus (strain CBS 115571) TaxID=1450538 RepID=A0A2V5HSD7_ASPV1|nr:hypothetical protein BO99DRAFT_398055 [Aspergillus violaceofuscus CBS 115571]
MPCNVINNPSFETGALDGWYASAGNVANIVQGTIAHAGKYYLDVTGTEKVPQVSVAQDLYWLDDENEHNLTLWVRVADPIPSTGHCEVSAYLGEDPQAGAIASDFIWHADEWIQLTGSIQPPARDLTLHFVGSCVDAGKEVPAHILFDDVVLSDC